MSGCQHQIITNVEQLQIGDLVFRQKWLVMHVGICVGDDQILHNNPEHGEHSSSLDVFAQEKTVYRLSTDLDPNWVILHATQILTQPQNYHLLTQNCEHTVAKITRGQFVSHQLDEVEAWGLIGAAIGYQFGRKGAAIGGMIGVIGGVASLPFYWRKQLK